MKSQIRDYFKNLRKNYPADALAKLSEQAQELFLSSELYQNAKNIMVYMPIQNETKTDKIILKALADNKTVLLPVTSKDSGEITAVVYTPDTPMEKGAFSIDEPKSHQTFDKREIDLVLVPGVSYSVRGGRIGFGKGCYDRFLDGMTATRVGFCYNFQLSNKIRPESHDALMDYIVTDKKISNCKMCSQNMKANYHTHTYLCHHASDTPRDYVENAIDNGLEILGFSDHNPCPFSNGFSTTYRIDLEDTENYVTRILALKEEFKYQIDILLGYEAEYYPAEFENTIKFIKNYPCDYLIMGQHFTKNGYDGDVSGKKDSPEYVLTDYVDQLIEGMNKGVFSYIAHPDMINYRQDAEVFKREILRLLKEAKRLSIPVEFNLLGFEEGRHYPYDLFWEIVAENGNTVIVGCDAHRKDACANPEIYKSAIAKLKEFGIVPIDYLTLKEV